MNKGELVAQPQMKMMNMNDTKAWYTSFVEFSKEIMKEGLDYGVIPGVSKLSLFKPGAEKLRFVYKLQTDTKMIDKSEDFERNFFDYSYRTEIRTPDDQLLATSEGNCNSYEPKFRYLWVKEDEVPEGVDKDKLKKKSSSISEFKFAIEKAETTGQYGKPQEYWNKFKKAIEDKTATPTMRKTKAGESPAWSIEGTIYRIENPDVIGLKNTLMKMADKRSFVGAMLKATGASEFYTQDVEDLQGFAEPTIVEPVYNVQQQVLKTEVIQSTNEDVKTQAEPPSQVENSTEKATQAQVGKIFAMYADIGLIADEVKAGVKAMYELTSFSELTKHQASEIISKLTNK